MVWIVRPIYWSDHPFPHLGSEHVKKTLCFAYVQRGKVYKENKIYFLRGGVLWAFGQPVRRERSGGAGDSFIFFQELFCNVYFQNLQIPKMIYLRNCSSGYEIWLGGEGIYIYYKIWWGLPNNIFLNIMDFFTLIKKRCELVFLYENIKSSLIKAIQLFWKVMIKWKTFFFYQILWKGNVVSGWSCQYYMLMLKIKPCMCKFKDQVGWNCGRLIITVIVSLVSS